MNRSPANRTEGPLLKGGVFPVKSTSHVPPRTEHLHEDRPSVLGEAYQGYKFASASQGPGGGPVQPPRRSGQYPSHLEILQHG